MRAEVVGWSLLLLEEGLSGLHTNEKGSRRGVTEGWPNSPPYPMAAPPFPQHFLQVSVTERVSEIPTDAQQNDLGFEMTPFERARIAHERNSSTFLNRSRAYYSIVIVATQPCSLGQGQTGRRGDSRGTEGILYGQDCPLQDPALLQIRERVPDDRHWQTPEVPHAPAIDRRAGLTKRSVDESSIKEGDFPASGEKRGALLSTCGEQLF